LKYITSAGNLSLHIIFNFSVIVSSFLLKGVGFLREGASFGRFLSSKIFLLLAFGEAFRIYEMFKFTDLRAYSSHPTAPF